MPKPVFMWLGSKRRVADSVVALVPSPSAWTGAYHEPMVGAGNVFLALSEAGLLRGRRVTLSDVNPFVAAVYQHALARPQALARALEKEQGRLDAAAADGGYEASKALFMRDRAQLSAAKRASGPPSVRDTARFVSMMTRALFAKYRENALGDITSSFIRPGLREGGLMQVGKRAALVQPLHAELTRNGPTTTCMCADYARAVARARRGDLVVFDPPYARNYAGRKHGSYHMGGDFDLEALARVVDRLDKRGCLLVVWMDDDDDVERLFRGSMARAWVTSVAVQRPARPAGHKAATERAVTNFRPAKKTPHI